MTPTPQEPYEQLLALGVSELELVRQGRLSELACNQQARSELMASLPTVAPTEARQALELCAALEAELEAELQRVRGAVLEELAIVRRAQRAADGYTPPRQRQRLISADA